MSLQKPRLTKRQKRLLRQEKVLDKQGNINPHSSFSLKKIVPMTDSQKDAFEAYEEGYNLVMTGVAGTGKTFVGMYLALRDIMNKVTDYQKLFIVRSVVPTRDMGFLPGNQKEKTKVYESPYYEIASKLFGRGDAYDILKSKNIVEFMSTSFIRGITLEDCIILVDECQNMSSMELHSIMTRVGENSKIVFSGDIRQDDLTNPRYKEESGLRDFLKILDTMNEFDFIEYDYQDIVRSGLVKSYIIAKDKLSL